MRIYEYDIISELGVKEICSSTVSDDAKCSIRLRFYLLII